MLLTDFGIAKGLDASGDDLTSDNVMMGTAKYLSPEQVRGRKLDGRADLYSLGLVLYECLAGRVPFLGETDADTALARLQRDPTDLARLRPTLPRGLVDLIHRLLARNPNRRPATGAELRAELLRLAGEPLSTLERIEASDTRLPGQPQLRRSGRRLDVAGAQAAAAGHSPGTSDRRRDDAAATTATFARTHRRAHPGSRRQAARTPGARHADAVRPVVRRALLAARHRHRRRPRAVGDDQAGRCRPADVDRRSGILGGHHHDGDGRRAARRRADSDRHAGAVTTRVSTVATARSTTSCSTRFGPMATRRRTG